MTPSFSYQLMTFNMSIKFGVSQSKVRALFANSPPDSFTRGDTLIDGFNG